MAKKELPSVTQILHPYSGFSESSIPEGVLEHAAERGTMVHSYCSEIAKGRWTPDPPEEYRGYVSSFRWWFTKFVDETLLCEEELVDEQLGYKGHPDLVVLSKSLGGVVLVDLKTPIALGRLWGSQLAAYKRLVELRGFKPDRIGSLRLSPEGKPPKFQDYTDEGGKYFAGFYSALQAHKFFMQK